MGNSQLRSSAIMVSRNKLNSDELTSKCCSEISYKIGSDWFRWGQHLGLSDSSLDNIGSDNIKNYEKAVNVLKKWKQVNGNPSWEQLKKELKSFERLDIVVEIERQFRDYLSSSEKISIESRIPQGCVFKLELREDEIFRNVEFKLYNDANNWTSIDNKKHAFEYYLTKKKNSMLFVKIENLLFENEKVHLKFLFQNSKKRSYQQDCSVIITGNCNYELTYNGLMIATPEPIFNNEFNINIRNISSLDWRETNNTHLNKLPHDKSIELCALDYFNRNFPDCNEVIYVSPSIADINRFSFVSKFIDLFTVNRTGIRAVLPGYRLRYHASLLKCNVEKFTNYNDKNRITIFCSELNLVIIARVANSMDCIKLESEHCLNDVILFVNVSNPLIETYKMNILGIVVLPLHNRKQLKKELFFYFSESFDLDQILFLCKDDIEDENFESWWRSVIAYCIKKVNMQNKNEMLFKKLISLTMMSMAKVDHCFPTLESDTQKQIQSLILNVEQRNAINDKALKKIITGGYGSGKSIVGKEIVKNCITRKSENSFTLYYICCNHFSLYECHMKEFVDSIEKTSNVTVVCDNLYNLWKNMCQKKNIFKKTIFLPKLLEYLANSNSNKVDFVLEELSEEYLKIEDAILIKHLFTSVLKESLVVFIPESITKNRKFVTNKQKHTLQRNCFQEEIIGMKVLSLSKSMRVTLCNQLLIDTTQKAICKTKNVTNFPNTNIFGTLQKIEKKKLFDGKDLQVQLQQSCLLTVDSRDDFKTKTDTSKSLDILNIFNLIENHENHINHEIKAKYTSQNDLNDTTHNDLNDTSHNNINGTLHNDVNDTLHYDVNDTSHNDVNDTFKVQDNSYTSVKNFYKNFFNYGHKKITNITNDKTDKFTNSNPNQSLKRMENNIKSVNDFYDNDLDFMAKIITKNTDNNNDPNSYMETKYVFKSGNIGHSIIGEKPKVIYLPFHDVTEKQSVKFLSIVLENLCFNTLKRTVVICNNMEEVQSVAYAIDLIQNFKAVTYSPHLQKYSPTFEAKAKVKMKLKNDLDILVTDCKGFSGAESESVIVFVSPQEVYLRHILVDAMSRSNSHLTILVLSCNDKEAPLNKNETIGNVLSYWSEDIVENIIVAVCNKEDKKSTDGFFIINENSKEFIDCGNDNDFEKYKEKLQFKIFHENDFIYETMAIDLSNQAINKFKKDKLDVSVSLKKFYIQNYEKINELQPSLKSPLKVDLLHKYVNLCIVDAVNTQMDAVFIDEQQKKFNKQINYTPIPYKKIITNEKSVILISGIAGIGKTWLLRKCLLDWSNGLIWKNIDVLFYLECRRLNQYQSISNINELLHVFYGDILTNFDLHNHTIMFIIDGLDEFKYLDQLINNRSNCNYPIVNVISEIQKYKSVIAGRGFAIDKYRRIHSENNEILNIQIMGFNDDGINDYIENNVVEEKKQIIKSVLNESHIAKAMANVPFYLSSMCKIISESKNKGCSFLTLTDLYANIFLYFLQKHINKNDESVYDMIKNESNKQYILNICKIAYEAFIENKVIFSKEEIKVFFNDFDKIEDQLFGFIEKIETNYGIQFQFAHLTIMEFCASVYAYNSFSSKEIMANKKLESCLPMIYGLSNKRRNILLTYLANLKSSNTENISLIHIYESVFSVCLVMVSKLY
ncbi:uncharacterized protein LOC101237642 isoform X2 [Hydra vulgaris]|uniref:uncharacterized protein LOC101237642 isoform X2 n=1 Tax=Hydra vulgaris TaxID=6087 RepID=UPI0032EA1F74